MKVRTDFALQVCLILLLASIPEAAFARANQQDGDNSLGGLIQQIQEFISQISQRAEQTLGDIESEISSVLGEFNFRDWLGDLGRIDPDKSRDDIRREQETAAQDPHIPRAVIADGVESTATGRQIAQEVLGSDGQTRTRRALEQAVAIVGESGDFANSSQQSADGASDIHQQVNDLSGQSGDHRDTSTNTSQDVVNQGQQAQGLTSSQDILKVLATQSGGQAQILSGLSSQFSVNAGQLGHVSGLLANHSTQNANLAALIDASNRLGATQVASLEELKQTTAASSLVLSELHEMERGNRQAEILQGQAANNQLIQFNRNGFRLMR